MVWRWVSATAAGYRIIRRWGLVMDASVAFFALVPLALLDTQTLGIFDMQYPDNPYLEPPPDSAQAQTLAHWEQCIRLAAAQSQKIRIMSGGKRAGCGQDSLIIDTTALQGMICYEPSELVCTAWAGTPLATMQAALAAQGQYLPFDPPLALAHSLGGTATWGSMVASGRVGPARMSSGPVRDYVLGLELIDGRGQRMHFGGTVIKNVAGFDVSRFLVGSWGQLGLMTRISLKVMPLPRADASVCWRCTQAQALQVMQTFWGQARPLHASVWQPEGHSNSACPNVQGADAPGTLALRWRGAQAAVAAAVTASAQLCRQLCERTAASFGVWDAQEADRFWCGVRERTAAWFEPPTPQSLLLRAVVPMHTPVLRLAAPPPAAASCTTSSAWLPPPLIDWHGCQRWWWMDVSRSEQQSLLRELVHTFNATVGQAGGVLQWGAAAMQHEWPTIAAARGWRVETQPSLAAIRQRLLRLCDPHQVFAGNAAQ